MGELSPYHIRRIFSPETEEPFLPDEEGVHLRDYWRIIRKRRGLVAVASLAVVLSTVLYTFTTERIYTATATLQIERQPPQVVNIQEVLSPDVLGADKYDYYQTQYQILASRSLATRVIRDLDLEREPDFIGEERQGFVASAWQRLCHWMYQQVEGYIAPPAEEAEEVTSELGVSSSLIDRYLGMLKVVPVRNSRLVRVNFHSKSPHLAAQVANAHAAAYIQQGIESRFRVTEEAAQFLESKLAELKEKVEKSEAALNKYRADHKIVSLDEKENIVVARLMDLNSRLTEAEAERIALESQYRLIRKREYESLPAVVNNPFIQRLKQDFTQMRVEYALMARKFKPGYPKLAQLKSQLDQAQGLLQAEIRKTVEGIESAYLAATAREEDLRQRLEEQKRATLNLKEQSAAYITLKRDVDTNRQLYSHLLQRMKEMGLTAELKGSNIQVVDRAEVPRRPSQPKTDRNLLLSVLVGLMLGTGLAFFLEYLDDTVKSPEAVERNLHLPSLGMVPDFLRVNHHGYGYGYGRRAAHPPASTVADRAQTEGVGKELVTVHHRLSVIAEAYRTVRTAILLSRADQPPQTILVTSAQVFEGKTVTVINMAATLAQSGAKVLIVDADLRKPRCHRLLGVENGLGLSQFLAGQGELGAAIKPTKIEGLSLLSHGSIPPNPAELVGSQRMRKTLQSLKESYDYILIDSPPLLPVSDALLLSAMVDGVVLVVRAHETSRAAVKEARNRLAYARAKILGVVLNRLDPRGSDHNYYRHYYSYYSDGATEEADGAEVV